MKKLAIISLLILTGCATQPNFEVYKTQKDLEAFSVQTQTNLQKLAQFSSALAQRVKALEEQGNIALPPKENEKNLD